MLDIVPHIWCTRNAEDAGAFYASAFQNASSEVESRYPAEGLPDFQREFAGEPLTVALTISGTRFTLINAGDEFHPNPSISFLLNFDPVMFDGKEELARASLERLWGRLNDGGTALMELDAYPHSPLYGWVQDRFGVSWQLMLTDPSGAPRPFITSHLMFAANARGTATEAVEHYLRVFPDAERGTRIHYAQPEGSATTESVLFSDFRLGNRWFAAVDAPMEQDFTFTPGISFEVRCRDQREIDLLWDALSAEPDAEQCGWLVDRFGVSWQVVPDDLGELMTRPGAYQRLLEMKKIVIADL